MNYNLEQIREAFWQTFHNQGEFWFNEREGNTQFYWEEFINNLHKNSKIDTELFNSLTHCPKCGEFIGHDHEKFCKDN